MRANIPIEWQRMSPGQRKKIEEYALGIARKQMEKDGRIMLDLYIKMVCLVLHDAFGFGEKRLTMFLGNHKRLFFRQQKMVASGTQIQYINERMNQIFRKSSLIRCSER